MNKIWNENEKNFIRNNAHVMKDRELAAKLTETTGRTVTIQAVRKQRQKLGIAKKHGRGVCGVMDKKERVIGQAVVQPEKVGI